MELFGLAVTIIVAFVGFGLSIGLLFGFFGMGGSFLVTPALLVTGYPVKVAIGSGLAFVFGTSVIGALRHREYGQVDSTLAALTILGMTIGIAVGNRAVFLLEELGSVDLVVSAAYVGLLAAVGTFTLHDARLSGEASDRGSLAIRVRAIRLPPSVTLADGCRVSAWIVLGLGAVVGVLSGFLGIGGGFLLLPAMMYGLGVPATVAVGTEILQLSVSSAFGAFVYASADSVALPAVGALLAGSALGARIGAAATTIVDEDGVKWYLSVLLLAGSGSVAAAELSRVFGIDALYAISITLIFGTPLLVSTAVVLAAVNRLHGDVSNVKEVA